ncbi:MAG: hypothetical protein LBG67_05695 [Campylobacteraceae bacterium]|jgi:hypothetical protein|nr:hypothetical protein [Campylobacteraceae bacterium]
MKKGFILFFLTALLFANEQKLNELENPFEFLSKNKSPAKPFTKEALEIPKNAKILKYIDISFEDEDGRIEKKTITIDKRVESQNNIIVSSDDVFNVASFAYSPIIETSFMTAPAISDKISTQPVVNKRVGIDQTPMQTTYVNNAETGETTKVADKLPLSYTQISTVEADKTQKTTNNALSYKIATTSSSGGAINLGDISIVDDGLFIKTDDKILKTLNMIKTDRKVVLDFDKKLPLFKTKTFRFDNSGFVSATLGAHPDYYRFGIVIDSKYSNFEVKEVIGGYIVVLK